MFQKKKCWTLGQLIYLYQQKTKSENIPLAELRNIEAKNTFWELDFMPSIIWPLRYPKPVLSGFLRIPGQSSTVFFTMIGLDLSNKSCIYTTLKFVIKESLRYNKTPVITFDQPLYWKSLLIVRNERESDLNNSVTTWWFFIYRWASLVPLFISWVNRGNKNFLNAFMHQMQLYICSVRNPF